MGEWLINLLIGFAQNHPSLGALFIMMGMFRAVFKPAMGFIEAWIAQSESKADDAWLEKMKANKFYQASVWLCDYLVSVKLPK